MRPLVSNRILGAAAGLTLALALAWLTTAWRLGPLWSSRPEYEFGWAGVFLCGALFWERWRRRPAGEQPRHAMRGWVGLGVCLAGLFLAKAALEVAPVFRPWAWALAGATAGATLAMIYLAGGGAWLRHFAFPVCFLVVFLPWPTRLENWVMDHLVEANITWVLHALGVLGVPALARGRLIELEQGMVGVDEACSGIRSLQATLVAALFLGELRRLPSGRRIQLLGAGLAAALGANFLRTFWLCWLADRQGATAAEAWHDPAGYGVLVINFVILLGVAAWLARRGGRSFAAATVTPATPTPSWPKAALWAIAGGVLISEVGWQTWFWRAEKAGPAEAWEWRWPAQAAGFREVPLGSHVQRMLGYDQGHMAAWMTDAGVRVQAAALRWKPTGWRPAMARAAQAQGHSPTVCLPAVGMVLLQEGPVVPVRARGREWPFQSYVFDDRGRSVYVYVCLWRDRPDLVTYQLDKRAMLQEVLRAVQRGARPMRTEQMLIMASLHGAPSEAEARRVWAGELERCLKPKPPARPVSAL